MPRNDQVTRQWHLLRTLEASREGVTLQGLAEGLPAVFTRHHRTIRRELEAPRLLGFPCLPRRLMVGGGVEAHGRIPARSSFPSISTWRRMSATPSGSCGGSPSP